MMPEEEGVPADERPAMQADAGETRPYRRMREARAAEGRSTKTWSTDMGEVRATAHATDMHAATEATRVHAAASEVATTAEAASATAKTATAATASGEHGRSERHHCCDRRRSETFEKPVVHRNILLAVRR